MKNLINWIIWLYKNQRENITLSFYEKNIEIYIDGKLISTNDENWHHIAVVAKDIPYYGWIEEITEYTKTNSAGQPTAH